MRVSARTFLAGLTGLALILSLGLGCSSDNPTGSSSTVQDGRPDFSAKPPTAGNGHNLIPNPGFEAGFWCWEYQPSNAWSISQVDPHSGDNCAQYTAPGGSGIVMDQIYTADNACVHVDGNSPNYRFSYWARMERPDGTVTPADSIPTIVMARLFVDGQEYFTDPMELTGSWRRMSQELTIPESGCGWLLVFVFGDATSSTLVINLDDFELRGF